MTKKTFEPKYKDEKLDIRRAWLDFAKKLLTNITQMEQRAEKDYIKDIQKDAPYLDRKKLLNKLSWCERQKEKINSRKIFALEEMDYEIINERGFENWFRNYDGYLFQ